MLVIRCVSIFVLVILCLSTFALGLICSGCDGVANESGQGGKRHVSFCSMAGVRDLIEIHAILNVRLE